MTSKYASAAPNNSICCHLLQLSELEGLVHRRSLIEAFGSVACVPCIMYTFLQPPVCLQSCLARTSQPRLVGLSCSLHHVLHVEELGLPSSCFQGWSTCLILKQAVPACEYYHGMANESWSFQASHFRPLAMLFVRVYAMSTVLCPCLWFLQCYGAFYSKQSDVRSHLLGNSLPPQPSVKMGNVTIYPPWATLFPDYTSSRVNISELQGTFFVAWVDTDARAFCRLLPVNNGHFLPEPLCVQKCILMKFGTPMHELSTIPSLFVHNALVHLWDISKNMQEAVPFAWSLPIFLIGLHPPGALLVGTGHSMPAHVGAWINAVLRLSKLACSLLVQTCVFSLQQASQRWAQLWHVWDESCNEVHHSKKCHQFLGVLGRINCNDIFHSVIVVRDSIPGQHESKGTYLILEKLEFFLI